MELEPPAVAGGKEYRWGARLRRRGRSWTYCVICGTVDFYNWNRVKLRYCDGASFGGDAEYKNGTTILFFRGQRIWDAIIVDLFSKGFLLAEKDAPPEALLLLYTVMILLSLSHPQPRSNA